MNSYVQFRLIADPDFPAHLIMGALWSKLHRQLVDLKSDDVGVSFPEIDSSEPGCGNAMRVHGAGENLSQWIDGDWLRGMRDHLEPFEISKTPPNCRHRNFRRVQQKSVTQMRQRLAARHSLTAEVARERIPDTAGTRLKLPFVMMRSLSTSQRFPLFVEAGKVVEQRCPGSFGSYGLSPIATTPWF